jgi:hypothetical protein
LSDVNVRFIQGLVSSIPELQPLLSEHLADNNQLLPHVFMGDVTRFVITTCQQSQELRRRATSASGLEAIIRRITSILEEALTSGPEATKELVAVSFVENLAGEDATIGALEPFLGPALKAEIASQRLLRGS